MSKRPIWYLQTDSRWKNVPYAAKGESTTIGGSGCGPTCMAMVLATWRDKSITPQTECAWAQKNGYKAKGQGTYYSYFVPAAKRYGLKCSQLNGANLYGNSSSTLHKYVQDLTSDYNGHLVIACMGKGHWTRSGHFVLVYKVQDGIVYINDPASTRGNRVRGDWNLFKQQVKYYWLIERPKDLKEVEEDLTEAQTKKLIRDAIDNLPSPIVYNTLEEIEAKAPWGYKTVEKLMAKDWLEGVGNGLSISFDMLRLLVILDRSGAFD